MAHSLPRHRTGIVPSHHKSRSRRPCASSCRTTRQFGRIDFSHTGKAVASAVARSAERASASERRRFSVDEHCEREERENRKAGPTDFSTRGEHLGELLEVFLLQLRNRSATVWTCTLASVWLDQTTPKYVGHTQRSGRTSSSLLFGGSVRCLVIDTTFCITVCLRVLTGFFCGVGAGVAAFTPASPAPFASVSAVSGGVETF